MYNDYYLCSDNMTRVGCYAVIISVDAKGSEIIVAIIIMMLIKTCSLCV